MSVYDRAPRNFKLLVGCTSAHVGPGSYNPITSSNVGGKLDGYAPFLSMTSRDTFPNVSEQAVAAPGPGQYDLVIIQDHIKGGQTVASKEKRFKAITSDVPGPGAYNPDFIHKSRSAPGEHALAKGMLMTNRIKFLRKPEAPSIPTQKLAFGYEECEDGTLKKQAPPSTDTTLGPAYYHPSLPDTKPTQEYRGVHFSKMASKRTDFSGKPNGPGPGHYDPFGDRSSKAENANIRDDDSIRFESRIPRYHEAIVKELEKQNIPGPGKYDIPSQFDLTGQPPADSTEDAELHPPFLSQAKRFLPVKNIVPAPGSYNDPRTALDTLKRISGLKRSPFGQTAVRFQSQYVESTPGPGSYNADHGLGLNSMRRAYLESTRKGAFGTTAIRSGLLRREDLELPGPAHYQPRDKSSQGRYSNPVANFVSVTSRLTEPPSVNKESPAPGCYNVAESYAKSQVLVKYAKPRTKEAAKKHYSFTSAAARFSAAGGNLAGKTDDDIPGPGSYDTQLVPSQRGGLMVTRDQRFRYSQSDTPGPATYQFSPLVQDSVLKGTFNATLQTARTACPLGHTSHTSNTSHTFLLAV